MKYDRVGEVTMYIVQPTARCPSKYLYNELYIKFTNANIQKK
jgi:hypothetical protein